MLHIKQIAYYYGNLHKNMAWYKTKIGYVIVNVINAWSYATSPENVFSIASCHTSFDASSLSDAFPCAHIQ